MTESRRAADLAYALMVDPASDERAARHAAFEQHLDAIDEAGRARLMSDDEKRAVLRAGMIARGTDAATRLATAGAL